MNEDLLMAIAKRLITFYTREYRLYTT